MQVAQKKEYQYTLVVSYTHHIMRGCQSWSNGQGLGPCVAGLREFEPRPPHSLFLSKRKTLAKKKGICLRQIQAYDCNALCGVVDTTNSLWVSEVYSLTFEPRPPQPFLSFRKRKKTLMKRKKRILLRKIQRRVGLMTETIGL